MFADRFGSGELIDRCQIIPRLNPSISADVHSIRTDHLYSRRKLLVNVCAASLAVSVVSSIISRISAKASLNRFEVFLQSLSSCREEWSNSVAVWAMVLPMMASA